MIRVDEFTLNALKEMKIGKEGLGKVIWRLIVLEKNYKNAIKKIGRPVKNFKSMR